MKARSTFLGLFFVCVLCGFLADKAQAAKPVHDFAEKATVSNQFEISSSRLAQENSQNDSVKQFAQQMINDHTQTGDQLKSVLSASNADSSQPTIRIDAKHQKILDQLTKLKGANFDKKYIHDQVIAHKQAVTLFTDYAKNGDNDALKAFAQQTLPTLQEHLKMAEQLSASNQ